MKKQHFTKYAVFLLMMLGLLSYINSVISESDKIITLIASYAFLIGLALLIGLNFKSIGLSKSSVKNGVIVAFPFMFFIVSGAFILFSIHPEIFLDSRYQLSTRSTLYSIFFVLPIFTVLIEELAFRGILFGTLLQVTSKNYAVFISSLAFGLWHIFTANAVNFEILPNNVFASKAFTVSGVILATSLAGVFFTWLRIKSGSLVAPILVHWTINASGIVLAYFAWNAR